MNIQYLSKIYYYLFILNKYEKNNFSEITETTGQAAAPAKGWAQQVDEAEKQNEKQMTLDEYKKQLEERKRAQQEKLPQFNRRVAGEGEDPKAWQKFEQEYRKKNEGEGSEDEELEEASGSEGLFIKINQLKVNKFLLI
jgi:hypothetical protein